MEPELVCVVNGTGELGEYDRYRAKRVTVVNGWRDEEYRAKRVRVVSRLNDDARNATNVLVVNGSRDEPPGEYVYVVNPQALPVDVRFRTVGLHCPHCRGKLTQYGYQMYQCYPCQRHWTTWELHNMFPPP